MENKKSDDLLELVKTAGLLMGTVILGYLWKDISKQRNEFFAEEINSLLKDNIKLKLKIEKIKKDGEQ